MGYSFFEVVNASRKHHVLLIDTNPGNGPGVRFWKGSSPVTFATDSGRMGHSEVAGTSSDQYRTRFSGAM
jgi:hypothetical protein